MIDIAQKYSEQLKLKIANTIYDLKYMFARAGVTYEYTPEKSTWNKHEFVSMKDSEIIGYISYNINRNDYSVSGLYIINFTDDKITFGRDLGIILDDIFRKFNFRKLTFGVYVGNPIEKSYDAAIKKFGGRIIGVEKEASRLLDGKFYDYKQYEIFREEYIKNKNKVFNKKGEY